MIIKQIRYAKRMVTPEIKTQKFIIKYFTEIMIKEQLQKDRW